MALYREPFSYATVESDEPSVLIDWAEGKITDGDVLTILRAVFNYYPDEADERLNTWKRERQMVNPSEEIPAQEGS